MATNRSRRLRKKLCVDEFQEVGFELLLEFREDLEAEAVEAFTEAFLAQAIGGNGLIFVGCDEFGMVCLAKRGSVNAEQRAAVEAWLQGRGELASFKVGELVDAWYPDRAINAA